jgi:hypothetical protein
MGGVGGRILNYLGHLAARHQYRHDDRHVSGSVFLIQHTPNRDAKILQLKIDELIRAVSAARTKLVGLEDLPDERSIACIKNFSASRKSGRNREREMSAEVVIFSWDRSAAAERRIDHRGNAGDIGLRLALGIGQAIPRIDCATVGQLPCAGAERHEFFHRARAR